MSSASIAPDSNVSVSASLGVITVSSFASAWTTPHYKLEIRKSHVYPGTGFPYTATVNSTTGEIAYTASAATASNTNFLNNTLILENAVPPSPMTANTTSLYNQTNGNGTYIASGTNATTAWQAFDNNNTTYWAGASANYNPAYTGTSFLVTGYNGEYLTLKVPSAILLSSYKIVPNSTGLTTTAPKNFRLYGSNNGTTWEEIQTQTNITGWASSGLVFNVVPSKAYSYFGIVVNAIVSGTGPVQMSLQLYERPSLPVSTYIYPPVALSNNITTVSNAHYGNGVYCIRSSTSYGTGYPHLAFNKIGNDNYTGWSGYSTSLDVYDANGAYTSNKALVQGYSGEWIAITMPKKISVSSYRIFPRSDATNLFNIRSPTNFRLYGSDSGKDWVLLNEQVNFTSWTKSKWSEFNVNTPHNFSHFALAFNKVYASAGTNSIDIEEIMFISSQTSSASCITPSGETTLTASFTPSGMTSKTMTLHATGITNTSGQNVSLGRLLLAQAAYIINKKPSASSYSYRTIFQNSSTELKIYTNLPNNYPDGPDTKQFFSYLTAMNYNTIVTVSSDTVAPVNVHIRNLKTSYLSTDLSNDVVTYATVTVDAVYLDTGLPVKSIDFGGTGEVGVTIVPTQANPASLLQVFPNESTLYQSSIDATLSSVVKSALDNISTRNAIMAIISESAESLEATNGTHYLDMDAHFVPNIDLKTQLTLTLNYNRFGQNKALTMSNIPLVISLKRFGQDGFLMERWSTADYTYTSSDNPSVFVSPGVPTATGYVTSLMATGACKIRFSGFFRPKVTGNHTFTINSVTNVARMWIGEQARVPGISNTGLTTADGCIFRESTTNSSTNASVTLNLTAGLYYPILIYYGNTSGTAEISITFTEPSGSPDNNFLEYVYSLDY